MTTKVRWVLGVVVLITVLLNSASGCPKKCRCYIRSWLITNCRGKILTSFPDNVDNATVELILTYNRLTALPPYQLQLPNLTILDLHDNRINNLSNCATLKGLRRLSILYLSNNFLDSIPDGCFLDLKSLKHLYLYNNHLQMLTPGMLRGPEGLQSLFLGDNQIKKVADDVFQNVSNGFKLDIGRNKMNGVPDAVKGVMDRLSYLDLSSCSISSLEGLVRQPNTWMISLWLGSTGISEIPNGFLDNFPALEALSLSGNNIRVLSNDTFSGLPQIRTLYLSNNKLEQLPSSLFNNNTRLQYLYINNNKLEHLHSSSFSNNAHLLHLNLNNNKLVRLPLYLLSNNTKLEFLSLDFNKLSFLPDGLLHMNHALTSISIAYNQLGYLQNDTFFYNADLQIIYLAGNRLTHLPNAIFRNCRRLVEIIFENNLITSLPENLTDGLNSLQIIFPRNKLSKVPSKIFQNKPSLKIVFLGMNNLSSIQMSGSRSIKLLLIHQNQLVSLDRSMIRSFGWNLEALWASYNNIEEIPDYTFINSLYFRYLVLSNNKIRRITTATFYGAYSLQVLYLSHNPINYIADRALPMGLRHLYLLETHLKIISCRMAWLPFFSLTFDTLKESPPEPITNMLYMDMSSLNRLYQGFESAGFKCNRTALSCTPCMIGYDLTYGDGHQFHCRECPAGGFYQDSLAFYGDRHGYGNGCQLCPNGTFVSLKAAPGTSERDCLPCPEGTKNDDFAGFRACICQSNYYRLDRFDECLPCPEFGAVCFNESMTLKNGYFWSWRSNAEKEQYINFTSQLQIFNNTYSRNLSTFNGSFPQPHLCRREESCLGGLDSNCAVGYKGPLCAVCEDGHYQFLTTCPRCPTLTWLLVQVGGLVLVVSIIAVVIAKGRKRASNGKRSLTDIILARLKILVSFYQITSGTLSAFSYIKWPPALIKLSEYASFLQFNIMRIAPLQCFHVRFKTDAYGTLIVFCSMTAIVIAIVWIYYGIRKIYLKRKTSFSLREKKAALDATKEVCYRNTFLFLFITYPQTSSSILQMLPQACHRICQDMDGTQCSFFLKADYSVQCFTEKYNTFMYLVYILLLYPLGIPLLTAFVLWKYHYKESIKTTGSGRPRSRATDQEEEKDPAAVVSRVTHQLQRLAHSKTKQQDSSGSLKEREMKAMRPKIVKQTAFVIPSDETKEERYVSRRTGITTNNSEKRPSADVIEQLQLGSYDIGADARNKDQKKKVTKPSSKFVRAAEVVFAASKTRRSGRSFASTLPLIAGMSFIFENYAEECWFWEVIEMSRKLALSSALALIGAEGRLSLGVASILSGSYAMLHAYFKPIPDSFEHSLQLTSLIVTFANTCVGTMLKVDQGALLDADQRFIDSILTAALLVFANVLATVMIVVKYVVSFGRVFVSFYKNPRCSLGCCVTMLLTAGEVQEEAFGLEDNKGFKMKSQIQSGPDFGGLSMEEAVGDLGILEVELEEPVVEQTNPIDGEDEDEEILEEQQDEDAKRVKRKKRVTKF
ncbi:uncharacterized protein LOC116617545 isoform X2 [Nematostella vectensis]|uniref:uncharacterized protein LOC116617545 isoform X2 n=1 Tax=Nematostella vectensis TaxID=45351 RepID=UPI00207756AC|nr:uncharacterized protein LOC116617545 isoform X2 [Nematostella vectensis]